MNHLVWRLHRNQVYFATAALGALAVLLVVTGTVMAHDYHRFLATCAATQSCDEGQGQLFSGDGAIFDIVNLTMVVPLLFGLFWGAPLVAKEFEDGTHNLVWTQGVTRRHWLRTNVTWVLLAAAVWGRRWPHWSAGGAPRRTPSAAGSTPSTSRGSCPWPTRCSPWPSASPSGRCSGGCCRPSPPPSVPSWPSGWPSGSTSGRT